MTRARAELTLPAALLVAAALLFGAVSCGTEGGTRSTGPTSAAVDDTRSADDTEPADTEATGTESTGTEPVDDTGPGGPTGACDLLTRDDVAEVFGEPVEAGGTSSSSECWWHSEDTLKTVNLIVSEPDLDDWRSGLDNDSWEPIDLGDEGYVGVGMFDTVEFLVGDRVLEINVIYSTSGDADAALEELAERVAARA